MDQHSGISSDCNLDVESARDDQVRERERAKVKTVGGTPGAKTDWTYHQTINVKTIYLKLLSEIIM